MDKLQITCDRVDREDLDTRYLAGTLGEELAEAFEAHYFECDRCWGLVHGGAEVRSAGPVPSVMKSVPQRSRRWSRLAWAPLAAAAALVIWVGTRSPDIGMGGEGTALRGTGDSLSVSAASTGGLLEATWSSVTNASSYHVRLFTANGDLLWDRGLTDTTFMMARDSIPGAAAGGLFWQVQAFDLAGAALARSSLIEVPPDSAGR